MESAEAFLQPVPAFVWRAAAASFAGYAILYRLSAEAGKRYLPAYKRLSHDKQVDWNTRLPSTVHAVLVSAICLHQLLSGAFSSAASAADGVPPVLRTTGGSWAAVALSLGYFVADGFMVFSQEALYSAMILVHHVVALLSLATAIDIRAAHAYVLFGLFTEVTTPFVNLRWRLQEAGRSGGRLYLWNGLAMTAVWGACRVLAFAPLFGHVIRHYGDAARYLPVYSRVVLIGVPALLFVMNLLWFQKMLSGAVKMVRRRGSSGGGGGAEAAGGPAAGGEGGGGAGKAARRGGRKADAAGGSPVLVEAYAAADARKEE